MLTVLSCFSALSTHTSQPGAVDVFLDFISYSGGPLPEELISRTTRPVSIVWGEADPWEDVKLGRKYFGGLPAVKEFITLPGGCAVGTVGTVCAVTCSGLARAPGCAVLWCRGMWVTPPPLWAGGAPSR